MGSSQCRAAVVRAAVSLSIVAAAVAPLFAQELWRLEGIIRQISVADGRLVIETDNGEILTVRGTTSTPVVYKGATYRFANLEVGDRVSVDPESGTATGGGEIRVRSIQVTVNSQEASGTASPRVRRPALAPPPATTKTQPTTSVPDLKTLQLTGRQMADRLRSNVVRIEAQGQETENGFGFIVGERGGVLYVVTAYHVVSNPQNVGDDASMTVKVEFYDHQGEMFAAKLLGTKDVNYDLAVLTVPIPPGFAYTKACVARKEQQNLLTEVWIVGRSRLWRPNAGAGHVSSDVPENGHFKVEGLPVKPGSSGGPVIASTGIIGMVLKDSEEDATVLSIDIIQAAVQRWNHPWKLEATSAPQPSAASPLYDGSSESYYQDKVAELHTSAGEIDIRFFPDVAPNHVKNFIDLSKKGFYNGTKFHRVMPGFMIQGGDPNTVSGSPATWGTGGSGKNVNAEFNSVKHKRGVVSMARSNNPDSASSQFFIMVADYPSLDNQYSVFGQVTKGMDVADKIVNARTGAQDRPIEPTTIERIVIREAKADEKGPAPR
ncbi:MAG: peptidylprolyl isomerase [Acidobacteriota bacterium]